MVITAPEVLGRSTPSQGNGGRISDSVGLSEQLWVYNSHDPDITFAESPEERLPFRRTVTAHPVVACACVGDWKEADGSSLAGWADA